MKFRVSRSLHGAQPCDPVIVWIYLGCKGLFGIEDGKLSLFFSVSAFFWMQRLL